MLRHIDVRLADDFCAILERRTQICLVERDRQDFTFQIQEFRCLLDCLDITSINRSERDEKEIPEAMAVQSCPAIKAVIKEFAKNLCLLTIRKRDETTTDVSRRQDTELIS